MNISCVTRQKKTERKTRPCSAQTCKFKDEHFLCNKAEKDKSGKPSHARPRRVSLKIKISCVTRRKKT
jgi:hypothetical protein